MCKGRKHNSIFDVRVKTEVAEELSCDWIKENVLHEWSEEDNVKVVDSFDELLKEFSEWWLMNKGDSEILWHMGITVESGMFRKCFERGYLEEFDTPYIPVELSTVLGMIGKSPEYPELYLKDVNCKVDKGVEPRGSSDPVYNAEVALTAYKHIISGE